MFGNATGNSILDAFRKAEKTGFMIDTCRSVWTVLEFARRVVVVCGAGKQPAKLKEITVAA
jgi:hypothetical protein